mmetsp:Transcript_89928/g.160025  ORF Transcript_89928/g.160025 Transcript_89928/m.160025 type:complete len:611 (-) Transcript_89928:35-1867(-)
MLWRCLVLPLILHPGLACTDIVIGKAASKDGSVILTQSEDGDSGADARLCYVPARDHEADSRRAVFFDIEAYPRHVGLDRGPCYAPRPGQNLSVPIGHLPQVSHTYAYFDATYGMVNEHGLGIGESTCSGKFSAKAKGHGGEALFSIDSLSRIALEREKNARDAVKLIGGLAEQHGFYGVTGNIEVGAESLVIGDPDEAFIFHILADPTGRSAIWAAQRVPDDHVAVIANMFVIREINFTDSHNFLFSESVKTVASDKGWWKPEGGKLDFTKLYSNGEFAHKFYSGRRMWGAYRLLGVDTADDYTDLQAEIVYPVTAKPKELVGVRQVFDIYRDYYQGTKYDMTKGLAAGPFGDPDRFDTESQTVKGNWERSIGLYRTSSTHVVQTRRSNQGAVLWFGPHAAAGTVFLPIAAKATVVPHAYTVADPKNYSRDSAYWWHRHAFNAAKIRYNTAMQDLREIQVRLEDDGEKLVQSLQNITDPQILNEAYAKHAVNIQTAFSALPTTLMTKYADGWLNDDSPIGYSSDWLQAVGYSQGPPDDPHATLLRAACEPRKVKSCVDGCETLTFASCALRCTEECHDRPENAKASFLVRAEAKAPFHVTPATLVRRIS